MQPSSCHQMKRHMAELFCLKFRVVPLVRDAADRVEKECSLAVCATAKDSSKKKRRCGSMSRLWSETARSPKWLCAGWVSTIFISGFTSAFASEINVKHFKQEESSWQRQ